MLYTVKTILVSWTGEAKRLVELSAAEFDELGEFLEKESHEGRLFGYEISPISSVLDLKGFMNLHKSDLEFEKGLEQEETKKGTKVVE
jgi:hypothetical protein